jgi:hypothetical protein
MEEGKEMIKLLYAPWFFDIAKLGVGCTSSKMDGRVHSFQVQM